MISIFRGALLIGRRCATDSILLAISGTASVVVRLITTCGAPDSNLRCTMRAAAYRLGPVGVASNTSQLKKVKSSMARSLPERESTTTECGVNYQLLSVMH